jgi:hypothetical protein
MLLFLLASTSSVVMAGAAMMSANPSTMMSGDPPKMN